MSPLPRTRYIYGDAKAGGKLVAALKALDLGSSQGEPSMLARKVATLFDTAGIPTRLHSDMLHYLWVQYAINGGPWAALVHAGSSDDEVWKWQTRCISKCLRCVTAFNDSDERSLAECSEPEITLFANDRALFGREAVVRYLCESYFHHKPGAKLEIQDGAFHPIGEAS
jgi:hypothetical protein